MEDVNMPRPTPIPVREAIYKQYQQGRPVGEIARSLNLSERTVRHLIKRFRERGEAGISVSYTSCGRQLSPERRKIREAALHLRREHPTWGSTVIQVMLAKNGDPSDIPTPRTIRRWLAQSGLGPAPQGKRPQAESSRACRPHETWQMDASEEICLANGSKVSWLRIVDEFSGAVLMTRVFSLRTMEPCRA
jgi:transposase